MGKETEKELCLALLVVPWEHFISSSPVRAGFWYLYSIYGFGRVGRPIQMSATLYEAAPQEEYQNELLSL